MNINTSELMPIKVTSEKYPLECLKYKIKKFNGEKLDISINLTDFYSTELYGIYLKFQVALDTFRVRILINNKIGNTCWERYVGVKELSHIVVGSNENTWTEDVPKLIAELADEDINIFNSSNKNVLETEYITPIMAMELLVPYCYNDMLIDSSLTSLEIATQLRVPEKIIDILKREDYQKIRISAYSQV